MEKLWYVVNTYSGHESKVKEKLEAKIESMGMQDYIYRIVIPETTEVEVKDGVKKEKIKKMFPGYIWVEMIMSDEAWYIVRNTRGVTGFVGSGTDPIPLTTEEIRNKLKMMINPNINFWFSLIFSPPLNLVSQWLWKIYFLLKYIWNRLKIEDYM